MTILNTLLSRFSSTLDLLFVFAAAYLVVWLATRRASAISAYDDASDTGTAILAGALVGARLVPLLVNPPGSLVNILQLQTGLSFYGGVLGAAVVIALAARRATWSAWLLADAIALYLPLGVAFQRLGCVAYGYCGGKPAPFPLGLHLPGTVGTHVPSSLYEGILGLILFAAAWQLVQQSRSPGWLTGFILAAYSPLRGLIDLTRFPHGPWPWLDPALSALFMVGGILLLVKRGDRRETKGQPATTRAQSNEQPATSMRGRDVTGPRRGRDT